MIITIDGPRACKLDERADMIALIDSVMRVGTGQSVLTDYPLVYCNENLSNVQIIKVNGRIVSVVPFIPHDIKIGDCHFKIGIISPTVTHPEHRKQGYARLCLKSCVQLMEQSEIDLSVLWTMVPTFEFYRHAEYQAIGEQHSMFQLTLGDAREFELSAGQIDTLNVNSKADMDAIRRLHEQEPTGVYRPAGNYPLLFSLPRMKTLFARQNGNIVAYLLVSYAVNKPGLIEAGGNEIAISSLIRHVLSQLPLGETMRAYINHSPHAFDRVLHRALPGRRQPSAAGHEMIRINHPMEFLNKISPSISVKTAETLARSRLSRKDSTAAIFGAHMAMSANVPNDLHVDPAFYFPIWMLDHS